MLNSTAPQRSFDNGRQNENELKLNDNALFVNYEVGYRLQAHNKKRYGRYT